MLFLTPPLFVTREQSGAVRVSEIAICSLGTCVFEPIKLVFFALTTEANNLEYVDYMQKC